MKAWPRREIGWRLAAALVLAVFAAAFAWASLGPLGAIGVGLGVAVTVAVASGARYLRRHRLLASPFPEAWAKILERRVSFYRRLPEAARRRFEDDVRIFLLEQRIYATGPSGGEVDDPTRVLVAASAAMLCHGWPDFEWPRVRDIVVYPRSFDEDYAPGGNVAGMVHTQGPILISRRDLRLGFARPTDGHNVGVHELAHVLDLTSGAADGAPAGAEWVATAPWLGVIHDRLRKMRRRGGGKVLRSYAATNEAELFAVAVEAFFEKPRALRDRDPELYAMLAEYFRQDPAADA